MTISPRERAGASLAAVLLTASVALAACGTHPSAGTSIGTSSPAGRGARAGTAPGRPGSAAGTPGSASNPASVASPTTPASAPTAAGAAQTAAIAQDLNGISNDLAAAGQDLQAGTTQQTIDPRG